MMEIDTGPGLETQFSWDYSHARFMVEPSANCETKSSQKRMQHAEESHSGSGGIDLHRGQDAGLTSYGYLLDTPLK